VTAPLTAAEAWALASKVALVDAKAALAEAAHCHPQEAAALRAQALGLRCVADALLFRALTLDESDDLELRVNKYMRREVKPAAHYATPMSAADKRRALGKPSRRRGTKPASLPQTLSAACHTLKEP
jgi:hypothetical protein